MQHEVVFVFSIFLYNQLQLQLIMFDPSSVDYPPLKLSVLLTKWKLLLFFFFSVKQSLCVNFNWTDSTLIDFSHDLLYIILAMPSSPIDIFVEKFLCLISDFTPNFNLRLAFGSPLSTWSFRHIPTHIVGHNSFSKNNFPHHGCHFPCHKMLHAAMLPGANWLLRLKLVYQNGSIIMQMHERW